MPTLITTGNSSGETGRCDAKCYNAKGPICKCCCGGLNHGKGLQKAMENIEKQSQEMIEEWKKIHPADHFILEPLLF